MGGKVCGVAFACSWRVERISGSAATSLSPHPPLAPPLQIRTQALDVCWSLGREAARRQSPGRALRAIQSVITGLIVKMRSRGKNIFILNTFFAAFGRRMFHIIREENSRASARKTRPRLLLFKSAFALVLCRTRNLGCGRRSRSDRRRLISIHSLREHRVTPTSLSEFRYSTNRRRPMAASASASASASGFESRRFTLVYRCLRFLQGSARKCKKVQPLRRVSTAQHAICKSHKSGYMGGGPCVF